MQTTVKPRTPPTPLEQVREKYQLRQPAEVTAFLRAHPYLIPLLLEGYEVLCDVFGPDPELALEMFTDPGEEHPEEMVYARILIDLTAEEAFERKRRFDQRWWVEHVCDSNGRLAFHVEFA